MPVAPGRVRVAIPLVSGRCPSCVAPGAPVAARPSAQWLSRGARRSTSICAGQTHHEGRFLDGPKIASVADSSHQFAYPPVAFLDPANELLGEASNLVGERCQVSIVAGSAVVASSLG